MNNIIQKNIDFYKKNSIFYQKNDYFLKKAINLLQENQRIDDLQRDGLCLIQNIDGYSFTSDSVLLSHFCTPKNNSNLLELCAGCGIISVLLNYNSKLKSTTAIELQPSLYKLCKTNFEITEINGVAFNADLTNYKTWANDKKFDCVVCNPPYEKLQTSFQNQNPEIAIARSEIKTTFEQIAETVKNALNFGGEFYFLNKAERLAEVFDILKNNNLEPKTLQLIYEKPNTKAKLFMCKAVLGGKQSIDFLEPIYRCNLDGTESEQIKKIYRRN